MAHPTMDRCMIDTALYSNALKDVQKKMQTVHKSVVNLDIKVKKWKMVPEVVSEHIGNVRSVTTIMQDDRP